MTATFWSAAVFRRFWGKRESPSALDYHADLRAAEHPPSPSRVHSKLGCAMGYGVAGRRTPQRKRNYAPPITHLVTCQKSAPTLYVIPGPKCSICSFTSWTKFAATAPLTTR